MSPILLFNKADNMSWQLTVGFRALNACTEPAQSIILNIQKIIDFFGGQEFYTSLSFQSGLAKSALNGNTAPVSLENFCGCRSDLRVLLARSNVA
uniref:Uncharacterized protein n=1 Tax=Caenorhabditis japonica TaxID=281687 RepID=A0A8R1HMV5_CAEJA